ncbi:MAG: IscS subfamily cysteine desulfurase [Lachnospiraceae bacterium]|nr:IscS subfamily cysteine desulfurase [Lachnospiraceae bacterium]
MKYIYADHAATTAISEEAKLEMMDCMDRFYGNPSSLHTPGQEAAEMLAECRETVAGLMNADPKEIYFTAGGSEADNQALLTAAKQGEKKGKRHIVSTAFEHHAVLHSLNRLEREGFEITLLPVYGDGLVRPADVAAAIREDTACVSVMYANNEIGTVQPIREIGEICRERGVLFHVDAVQAAGRLLIDVEDMKIDLLAISAHKFNGPRGIGALYCRKGIRLVNLIEGGAQERGKRAGTENLPAIAGMATAFAAAWEKHKAANEKTAAMRDQLIAGLEAIPHSRLNGDREKRLPGIVNFCFEGIEGESLLLHLDARGIAASSGSACTSGSLDPSHVLLALGLPHEVAHGSLRLSIGEENTPEEMDYIIRNVTEVVSYLRDMSPVWEELETGEKPHLL